MTDRPWLDPALPVEDRVRLLLAAMTPAEKVGQLVQVANVDPRADRDDIVAGRIGSSLAASGALAGNVADAGQDVDAVREVQRIAASESRLGIPLLFARDVIHGYRVVFPIPLGQAATFNPDHVADCARAAAVQAAADGVRWTFAPMVDIGHDPRWGRVAESYGEDPHLAGLLAAAAVTGFQGEDPDSPDSLAACAKHFVGYGLAAGGRDYDAAHVGPVTLANRHLRPFRAAVDAGAMTVMSAFQAVDGVPMTANAALLRGVLKDGWGFDGLVVSDWDAVAELLAHGVAADRSDAAARAIAAGVDVDMVSGCYAEHLADLVEAGRVTRDDLDDAVARVLRVKFRLGLFDHPMRIAAPVTDDAVRAMRGLARIVAADSTVLLVNDGCLPLGPQVRVHLTGPFAQATDELFGTWTLDGDAALVASLAERMAQRLGPRLTHDDGRFADLAVLRAREADVVVVAVGEHPQRSGEARSVTDLRLPPGQADLVRALAATGARVVAVVFAGRPLALDDILGHVDAILWAWHPGTEGAQAVVDVLVGDVEPGGRLPMSLPAHPGQVPVHHDHAPTGRPVPLARDRAEGRYADGTTLPQWPFGYGLTYTTLEYGPTRVRAASGGPAAAIEVGAVLRNTGTRPTTEVVQLYVTDPVAEISRGVRELLDVQRVHLAVGETAQVDFVVVPRQLGYVDATGTFRVDPGEFRFTVAGHSGAGEPVSYLLTD